jgi:HD-like signal output (HDOD) protein
MIENALPSLQAWTDAFVDADIPVLGTTATELTLLQTIEEERGTVDAHMLAESFNNDPLMTIKVLSHVSRYCTKLDIDPPETLIGAIVMQGIGPFFRAFSNCKTIADVLSEHPQAQAGLVHVLTRARRASDFAIGFALIRQDEDAVVIHEAALMHDFAEMLLWCHAPTLALAVANRLQADHSARSADIQREVLGVELNELAQSLMHRWQLPDLLIKASDDSQAEHPRERTVMLAVQLARHTQYGWNVPHAQAALPDDITAIAKLLNLSNDAALRLVQGMDD